MTKRISVPQVHVTQFRPIFGLALLLLTNCVTPPTTNCLAKLPVFPITSCTHYSHHHPPHHRTITLDTAHTHYYFLHTPHTWWTVHLSHACYIKTHTHT